MNPRLQSFMMKAIKASSAKEKPIGENVMTEEEMMLYREMRQYYFENKLKSYWTRTYLSMKMTGK